MQDKEFPPKVVQSNTEITFGNRDMWGIAQVIQTYMRFHQLKQWGGEMVHKKEGDRIKRNFQKDIQGGAVPVMVCAHNEENNIPILFSALANSTLKVKPVVIDDGSKDKTRQIVQDLGGVLVENKNRGLINALKTGLEYFQNINFSGTVLLTDSDSFPVNTWAERMKKKAETNGEGEIMGPMLFYGNMWRDAFRTAVCMGLDVRYFLGKYIRAHGGNCAINAMPGMFGEVADRLDTTFKVNTDDQVRDRVEEAQGNIGYCWSLRAAVITDGDRYRSIGQILKTFFCTKQANENYTGWGENNPIPIRYVSANKPKTLRYR